MGSYVEQILAFSPTYLHGYPSAIDVLAEYVLRHELTPKLQAIKAIFLGSEGVTKQQRERMNRAFGSRVYSWYGHSERVILAGECEKNSSYHHFPDYGVLEIIGENGVSCDCEGERGELVGTGLLNRSMPLIRYRTGDFATRLESHCECGRDWNRFWKVEGHWNQDMVIGKSGTKISVAALNMHGPLFERVIRYQYFQEKTGSCVIKLMTTPEFVESDRLAIQRAYDQKVGNEVDFNVQIVDMIQLSPRGKLNILDSKI